MPLYKGNTLIVGGGATVIETGRSADGNQWYRLWSDGWLEQGGTASNPGGAYIPITFLKPYTNTSYTIVVTPSDANPNDNELVNSTWQNKSGSGFNIYCCWSPGGINSSHLQNCWYTCGQS